MEQELLTLPEYLNTSPIFGKAEILSHMSVYPRFSALVNDWHWYVNVCNKPQLSRFIKMNYIPIIKVFCGFVSLSLQFSVQCFVDHCCLYVLFVWPLCILLRFMASNYSFGIFTLFFINSKLSIYWFSHARSQHGNLNM